MCIKDFHLCHMTFIKVILKKKIKVNIKTAELNFKKFKLMKLLLVYAIIFSNIILPSIFKNKKFVCFSKMAQLNIFVLITSLLNLQHFTFHLCVMLAFFSSCIQYHSVFCSNIVISVYYFFLVNSCFVFLLENWPVFL